MLVTPCSVGRRGKRLHAAAAHAASISVAVLHQNATTLGTPALAHAVHEACSTTGTMDGGSLMRERLITWGLRLGFGLVALLTVYILAVRP